MISKIFLDQAKSFLCFDLYPNLTIKLIAIDAAVAFFYPPANDLSTIIVFYEKNSSDFSAAVFLLFHEVGHFEQYKAYQAKNKVNEFWSLIEIDNGVKKMKFEREAWDRGKKVMKNFLEKYQYHNSMLIDRYCEFAERCLISYN